MRKWFGLPGFEEDHDEGKYLIPRVNGLDYLDLRRIMMRESTSYLEEMVWTTWIEEDHDEGKYLIPRVNGLDYLDLRRIMKRESDSYLYYST